MSNSFIVSALESSLKASLTKRLLSIAFIPNPIVGILVNLLFSKIIEPILGEVSERLHQEFDKHNSRRKLEEVNHAKDDATFTDAFLNL